MKYTTLLLMVAALLIATAIILPANNLSGSIIQEKDCGDMGCVELCEQENDAGILDDDVVATAQEDPTITQNQCSDGLVCCRTFWDSGVCDYEFNCDKIQEYSLYQSLETYSTVEQPAPIIDLRSFFIPLTITISVLVYFMWQRKKQEFA